MLTYQKLDSRAKEKDVEDLDNEEEEMVVEEAGAEEEGHIVEGGLPEEALELAHIGEGGGLVVGHVNQRGDDYDQERDSLGIKRIADQLASADRVFGRPELCGQRLELSEDVEGHDVDPHGEGEKSVLNEETNSMAGRGAILEAELAVLEDVNGLDEEGEENVGKEEHCDFSKVV